MATYLKIRYQNEWIWCVSIYIKQTIVSSDDFNVLPYPKNKIQINDLHSHDDINYNFDTSNTKTDNVFGYEVEIIF